MVWASVLTSQLTTKLPIITYRLDALKRSKNSKKLHIIDEWLRAHAVYLTSGTDCYGSFRCVYLCSDEYVVSVVIKVCSLLPRSNQRGRMHSITPCYYQTGLGCINEWRVQWSEGTFLFHNICISYTLHEWANVEGEVLQHDDWGTVRESTYMF